MPLGRDVSARIKQSAEEKMESAIQGATSSGGEDALFAALVWGGIYLGSLCLITLRGPSKFILAVRHQWMLFLFICLVPLSMAWSQNNVQIFINSIHALGALCLAFCAAMHYSSHDNILIKDVAMVLGVVVSIHLIAIALFPSVTISYDARWQGLTTNPNSLGLIAGLSILFSFLHISSTRFTSKFITWMFVCIGLLALQGSQSVTAYISTFLAVGSIWVIKYVPFIAKHPAITLFVFLPFSTAAGIFFLEPVLSLLLPMVGREGHLTGRLEYWGLAMALITDKPFLGWGFDNHVAVIDYIRLPTVHFHNGFLDLMVRGGYVALIMFVVVVVTFVTRMRLWTHQLQIMGWAFLTLFLIRNITEVTILAARNLEWFLFLLLLFLVSLKTSRRT